MLTKINSAMNIKNNLSSTTNNQNNPSFGLIAKVKGVSWFSVGHADSVLDNIVFNILSHGKATSKLFDNGDYYIACERNPDADNALKKALANYSGVEYKDIDVFNDAPLAARKIAPKNHIYKTIEQNYDDSEAIKNAFETVG